MICASEGTSPTLGNLEIDLTAAPVAPGTIQVHARPDLVASSNALEVILDMSGSMNKRLPTGESRIDAARTVLMALADTAFPQGVPMALRVFSHLEPNRCHMALELPLEPFNADVFKCEVASFEPNLLSGTPLADSIAAAGQDLAGATGRRRVLLVTDGVESCGGDPEAAIRALRAGGPDVTIDIIGFAVEEEGAAERFRVWAGLGGQYYDTRSGQELAGALEQALQPPF